MQHFNNNNSIIVSKPYIVHVDGYVRLCADIQEEKQKKTLYYEVEEEYEEYLNTDNGDTFVLGLLHNAMYEGKSIHCLGAVTERLLFQLNHFYIPVISNHMPNMQHIQITANEMVKSIKSNEGVATGCSGGVDSFYTMLRYQNLGSYSLTHVMFNNISTADSDDERIRKVFFKDTEEKREVARELGLKPIMLFTNLYSFYKSQYIFNYYFSAQYVSAAYALGNLINKYYFSSGVSFSDFSLNHAFIKDCAYFDLFSLNCFSTEYLSLYSAGSELSRFEKTEYISNNRIVQSHLQVCSVEQNADFYSLDPTRKLHKLNCGQCPKCRRTLATLYGLDMMDHYRDIFALDAFYNNKEKYIAYELEYDAKEFTEDIERALHKKDLNKIKLALYRIFYRIKHYLRGKEKLRRIYRHFKYGEAW